MPATAFAALILAGHSGFGPATVVLEHHFMDPNLIRGQLTYTLAIRADGSRAVRQEFTRYRYFFWPQETRIAWVRLEALAGTLTVRDERTGRTETRPLGEGEMVPAVWKPLPEACQPPWPGARQVAEERRLGLRVEVWRDDSATLRLAPELDCMAVGTGVLGERWWRDGRQWLRLVSFTRGEPDPALFLPPSSPGLRPR